MWRRIYGRRKVFNRDPLVTRLPNEGDFVAIIGFSLSDIYHELIHTDSSYDGITRTSDDCGALI